MRYGIFSDVHSNLEAFEAALSWFNKQKIDKYIFLGDIVGYGANPQEAIGLLRKIRSINIAGNHDWACVDKFNLDLLNSFAREAIIWTQGVLKQSDKTFLKLSSLVYEDKNFVCVHGSLYEPSEFHYVTSYEDARLCFNAVNRDICFIGHSHRPGVWTLKKGKINYTTSNKVYIEKGSRYIVNVGSVGQPRDGDNRGCVCIYDNEKRMVIFHRFEYNIKEAADKILNVDLPHFLAERLYVGR